jgi:hypothetical protein
MTQPAPIHAPAFAKVFNDARRPGGWDRPQLQFWRDRQDPLRQPSYKRLLGDVVQKARGSATASAALDWAVAHDIAVVVAPGMFGGYYVTGSGIAVLSYATVAGLHG